MLLRCLFYLILLSSFSLGAQFYSLGQNPSSTKWKQIKSDDFQLIFPEDFESKAQELANILNYANKTSRLTLKTKPRKISIVLQNNTTIDNGFVTLAPKRSEFYATPSQENEGVDWLKKLAVHEYRHVVQFEKYEEGVGKVLKIMFGQQGMGALILLTTPLWMIEGDAVGIETNHTERGRGDYGPFLREFKAQIMELDSLSYEKASFGSFKNYITDHYKLGYFLSEFVKDKYGQEIWDSVMCHVVRNPFPPYPFSYHLKKITGKSTNQLYGELVAGIKRREQQKSGFAEITSKEILTPLNQDYISYENPIFISDSIFIACKISYNKPLRIVMFLDGKEKLIHIPANYDKNTLQYQNGNLIWSEKRQHPRWNYLDFSEVIYFNLKTKKKKRIKRNTRWFAPTFNENGDQIALIEYDKANKPSLLIVDLNGELKARIELNTGLVYHPNWFTDDSIVVSRLINDKSFLEIISIQQNKVVFKSSEYSIPFSYPTKFRKGFLLQTLNGNKDCIAYLDLSVEKKLKLREVVNPEFGLNFFSVDVHSESIFYSDYHTQGFQIVQSELEIGDDIPFSIPERDKDLNVKNKLFKINNYKPLAHLFNFHSWAPISINPNEENANIGASVFSQNLLSSSILSVNYDYYSYTKSQRFLGKYEFEHFYPKFFGEASYQIEPNSKIQNVLVDIQRVSYQGGGKLNLYYNGNRFSKSVFLKGAYVHDKTNYDFEEGFIDTLIIQDNTQWIAAFGIIHKRAIRDIYSPLSLIVNTASYFNLREHQNAQVVTIHSTIQGLFKNDGFKFLIGKQWGTDLFVPNYLLEPRGVLNQNFKRGESACIEYSTPLFYPDFKISRLAFIKRIRIDVFYDLLKVNDDFETKLFSSQGGTLYFDFNPLRYSYLSTFGIQLGTDRVGKLFCAPSFTINY